MKLSDIQNQQKRLKLSEISQDPQLGVGGLTQEEVRARRLAGVPLDETEAKIMKQMLMERPGFLEGMLIQAGGAYEKVLPNIMSLFGSEEAESKRKEIAQNLEELKTLQPGAAFGDVLAIAPTIPLGGAATSGITRGLQAAGAGGLTSSLSASGIVGGTEAGLFAPGDESVEENVAAGAALGVVGDLGLRALGAGAKKAIEKARQGSREATGVLEEAPQLGEAVEEGLESVQQATKAKIDLLPAQATGEGLRKQAFLTGHDLTARKAAKALQKQNQQAYNAVEEIINDIAPPEAIERFANQAREFSNLAIQQAKEARKMATEPLYRQVISANSNLKVDLRPLTDEIKGVLDNLPQKSTQRKALKQVLGSLTKAGGEAVEDVGQLHKSRVDLGQFLYSGSGKKLAPGSKGLIERYRRQIGDILEETVPGYAEANARYAAESAPVKALQEGIIGRVASLSDDQLQQAGRKLLDPTNVDPSNVMKAKKVFQSLPGGGEAWREVVRGEVQRRLGSIKFDPSDIGAENVPQQILSSVFGNQKSKDILYRAVDQTTEANLRLLERVLKKASRGRTTGSPTAANQEVLRQAQGKIARGVSKVLSPKSTFEQWATNLGTDENLIKMANSIFDPVVESNLEAIRKSLKAQNKIPRELIDNINKYLSTGAGASSTQGEQ